MQHQNEHIDIQTLTPPARFIASSQSGSFDTQGAGALSIITQIGEAASGSVQEITSAEAADGGDFTLEYGEDETTAIAFDDTAADLQTALRLLTGLGDITVEAIDSEDDSINGGFRIAMIGATQPVALLTVNSSLLAVADPVAINIEEVAPEGADYGETNNIEFFMEHSDDDVTFTRCGEGDMYGSDDGTIVAVDAGEAENQGYVSRYRGNKRYARVAWTLNGNMIVPISVGAVGGYLTAQS